MEYCCLNGKAMAKLLRTERLTQSLSRHGTGCQTTEPISYRGDDRFCFISFGPLIVNLTAFRRVPSRGKSPDPSNFAANRQIQITPRLF